jgi:golgin subfamily B member 1
MVDLADIACKQFLSLTDDPDDDLLFLLDYLYQFRKYGEDELFSQASTKTTQVKQDLEVRIQKFNHWKATSKKSKSRTALLTGEVPKEELQFRKEKAELEREVFRLEVHETILKSDLKESEAALDRIKKSSNKTKEALRQSRKIYKKFGVETKKYQSELEEQGDSRMVQMKTKYYKQLTTMVISSYSKTIELIRKRQEKFLLIQSLHEVGNLYYTNDQLKHAETQWNDCIDAIFQKDVGIIKVFRGLFSEVPNLAATYGSLQCIIGGVVLAKLAKL